MRCESTKITQMRPVNTNLGVSGLDLHSNNPEPVNFFEARFSFGGDTIFVWGAQAIIWGARPRNALPWRPPVNES